MNMVAIAVTIAFPIIAGRWILEENATKTEELMNFLADEKLFAIQE